MHHERGAKRSTQFVRPLRVSWRELLALVAITLVGACAPSDFDEVVREAHDAATPCDPDELDAGCEQPSPPDAGLDAADGSRDAGTTPGSDADRENDARADGSASPPADAQGGVPPEDASADSASADGGTCAAATAECAAGRVEMQTEDCGACGTGTRTRSRTCSASTCSWGAWSDWSECSGVTAACSPGATMPCSPADSCGHRVCQDNCTWSGCVPIMPDGCLRRRNGTQVEGSNYRCCGTGSWQFCLPSCDWSTDCTDCTPGAPDFCSDCS